MVAEEKTDSQEVSSIPVAALSKSSRKEGRAELPEIFASRREASPYRTFLTDLRSAVGEVERLQAAIRQRQCLVGDGVEVGTAQIQARPARLSAEVLAPVEEALTGPLLEGESSTDGVPGVSYRLEAMYFVARRVVSDATADNLLKEVVEYSIQLGHYRFGLLAACEMRAVSNADGARGKVVEAALKEGDFAFALMAAELIENRSSADGAKGKVIKALRGVGKNGSVSRISYSSGSA